MFEGEKACFPTLPPRKATAVEPIRIDSMNKLLLQVSGQLQEHGWALICTEYQSYPYQFTLGLEHSFDHPELEVIGLPPDLGQALLSELVKRIKAGNRLSAGDFFSDLKKGYDFFLVENPVEPDGPAVTGGRLRLIWPDARHRYPWHPDCEEYCTVQTLLLEDDSLTMEGLETLLRYSGESS